ncbi:Voltage-dependent L-type calcium channel subunit beta-1 [Portunus trituberculatus]|uniref:Voltage-dependent L-type calcium channel subunit beta-1 n=1 Tax=Portunus trituberculatus TaxID=210409 RepID=A0A5B7D3J9_PORTR|nr:Voltage-dependent L-type calcium channel subunit beta-1 [Portunus trituberculatus]
MEFQSLPEKETEFLIECVQGSADSNYSQPSSDLSLDEERENLRRETERQALSQLEKARAARGHLFVLVWGDRPAARGTEGNQVLRIISAESVTPWDVQATTLVYTSPRLYEIVWHWSSRKMIL